MRNEKKASFSTLIVPSVGESSCGHEPGSHFQLQRWTSVNPTGRDIPRVWTHQEAERREQPRHCTFLRRNNEVFWAWDGAELLGRTCVNNKAH